MFNAPVNSCGYFEIVSSDNYVFPAGRSDGF